MGKHIIHPRSEKRERESRHCPHKSRHPSRAGRISSVGVDDIRLDAVVQTDDEADGEDASAEIGDGPVQLVGGGEAVDEEAGRDEEAEGEEEGEAVFGEGCVGVLVVKGRLVCSHAREGLARDGEVPVVMMDVGCGQEALVVAVLVCVMKSPDVFPCCCGEQRSRRVDLVGFAPGIDL